MTKEQTLLQEIDEIIPSCLETCFQGKDKNNYLQLVYLELSNYLRSTTICNDFQILIKTSIQ